MPMEIGAAFQGLLTPAALAGGVFVAVVVGLGPLLGFSAVPGAQAVEGLPSDYPLWTEALAAWPGCSGV
ncbi:MAG: hypothetical protein HY683_06405 [Chloroflexi bacterium]|nr:hypothetical protein [Chloroflexota bacterium]